jgi:hypothetical protein
MNRYQGWIRLEVYFDSETAPEDLTQQEVQSRAVDAVYSNDVIDSEVDALDFDLVSVS